MKRFGLVVFAAVASLGAADPDAMLMEKIYAKLASSFSATEALGQGGEFLILAHPGFPLTSDDLEDEYEISQLADQVPAASRFYRPSGFFYSTTYDTILTQAEVSNLQNMATRQEALKARRLTSDRTRPGKPTPAYAAYLRYEAAYLSAEDALTVAKTENLATGKPVPPGLEMAVKAALKDWTDKGNRKLIDDANAAVKSLYNENVKILFGSLLGDFAAAAKTAGHSSPWYPVTAVPPPREWLNNQDWKPFSLTSAEKSLAPAKLEVPMEIKPGTAKKLSREFASSVSITLEAKRVNLARPWLDERIFSSHGWRMHKASGIDKVSTGNPADQDPGVMPFLVTGFLLSRKLVIAGSWSQGSPDEVKTLGPFSLEGKAGRQVTSRGGKITISAATPEIIGFFCVSVPKCPDPDAKAFR